MSHLSDNASSKPLQNPTEFYFSCAGIPPSSTIVKFPHAPFVFQIPISENSLIDTSLQSSYRPGRDSKPSSGRITIDFKNDRALRCLTQAIMFRDFGIQLQIPQDRLCPPVPNRMNYVLWIQDIVKASETFRAEVALRAIRGIDIGTGATAIYPFLACTLEGDWEMVGTELDDISYESALRSVELNNLSGRITIKRAQRNGAIFFPLESEATSYDFTMCNPPFYSSPQEMDNLSKEKSNAPNAVCTGSDVEMVYPEGGEVGFVSRLVEESIKFQGRCRWYTSMLGRMSSVIKIIEFLRRKNISNYAITEFVQGRTRRWAVGWSFSETRLPDSLSRISLHKSHALASYMPLHTTLRQPLRLPTKMNRNVACYLVDVLKALEGVRVAEHKSQHHSVSLRIECKENSWSRSARRMRKRRKEAGEDAEVGRTDNVEDTRKKSSPELVCDVCIIWPGRLERAALNEDPKFDPHIDVHSGSRTNVEAEWTDFEVGGEAEGNGTCGLEDLKFQEDPGYSLECQWIFGSDHTIFETLVGHIGRKLNECIHTD